MCIIGIDSRKLRYLLIFGVCLLGITALHAQENALSKAEEYAGKSADYYKQAEAQYAKSIKESRDPSEIYFKLGELYYSHGDFAQAKEAFLKSNKDQAVKYIALSCYRLGDFTAALEAFNQEKSLDSEYFYYWGMTCEKLNLYDKALEVYAKIKGGDFKALAGRRIWEIQRQAGAANIKNIDPQIHQILSAAPSAEHYPQAGAFILSCREEVEVTAQAKEVSTLHYLIKILNERGKEEFSEVQIDYDSTYEKVELEYARVIQPDGSVSEVGSRHLRDVSKYLNFPLYSNARVFIISFPEITLGSAIEYKVRVFGSKLINKDDFVINYPLETTEPVISASFKLSVPKEKKVFFKIINKKYNRAKAKLLPRESLAGNKRVYSWGFKDIPQIIPEPAMSPACEINPAVLISTFKSWQEVYGWWRGLAWDKIKSDAAIKAKVKSLTAGAANDKEKARSIYDFCAQNIRYVAVEYGDAGYEPHAAADIFKNKYGDCKDQAILLCAMLKEAGIQGWPVLIPTKGVYDLNKDFPSALFNHCIAAAEVGGEVIFLDPTAETCSFGDLPAPDQGRSVLVFKEGNFKIMRTPLFAAEHNSSAEIMEIGLSASGSVNIKRQVRSAGIYQQAQRYWLLYTPPQLIEEALKSKAQEISIGAKLLNYRIENLKDLDKSVELVYSFRGPEYFTDAGPLKILPQLAGMDTSLVAKDKRVYPLDFTILDLKKVYLEIALPDAFVVKYIPPVVMRDSPWMRVSAQYRQGPGKIAFSQNVELKKTTVSQAEYQDFKSFIEGLAKDLKQRIVLEKAG